MKATPTNLAKLIRQLFKLQAAEALRLVKLDGPPLDLTAWIEPMAETLEPLLAQMYRDGMLQASARMAAKLGKRPQVATPSVPQLQPFLAVPGASSEVSRLELGNATVFGKSIPLETNPSYKFGPNISLRKSKRGRVICKAPNADIGFNYDLYNPKVTDAVDRLTLTLCRETLETSAKEANEAVADLRQLLRQGLPQGEANALLARKIRMIFNDPKRAFTIATTESSRAVHGGQMAAAIEAGVERHSWLASADACERCLELDGKTVDVGKPFWVDPKGGPYAVCLYPPLHPHCFCTTTEEL